MVTILKFFKRLATNRTWGLNEAWYGRNIRDKLKFRHHGTWQPSWNSLNSISPQTIHFNWAKSLVGGYGQHGVLDSTSWLCSGILYGSHFEILQFSSKKKHVVLNSTFVEGIWAIWIWSSSKEYFFYHGSHIEILKMTSSPWVANRPPSFMGNLVY